MNLKVIDCDFSVCKLKVIEEVNFQDEFVFLSKTDEEISLVCRTKYVPKSCSHVEEGWRGIRIEGELDFSLIGILSKISTILAENKIGIFVISTYNTDYILVKATHIEEAVKALGDKGYTFL